MFLILNLTKKSSLQLFSNCEESPAHGGGDEAISRDYHALRARSDRNHNITANGDSLFLFDIETF